MSAKDSDFSASSIETACKGQLHPMALEGINLFNRKEYWHAHEALEKAWLEEPGLLRDLYRGILQIGVVYLHIQRANYRGAMKVYHRSRRWLDPFPNTCLGIYLEELRADLEVVMAEARRLGPESLERFNQSLLKEIRFTLPSDS
jgi:uncharacterized protein